MQSEVDVLVIGAGPYGLSLASHLSGVGIEHRIFGRSMEFWQAGMPEGMHLKSDGFASNLRDPQRRFSLARFCKENSIAYQDLGRPVALDAFVKYGVEFQKRIVPYLEAQKVELLTLGARGFTATLQDGRSAAARRVVIASGLSGFSHIPAEVKHLPSALLSHSSDHSSLRRFKGKKLIVLGAGASAVDLAVLAQDSGADVTLLSRATSIPFHTQMQLPRPLWERMRNPVSGIGPSWRSRFFAEYPWLFRRLPQAKRLSIVRNYLGPAGGWFMKDRLDAVHVVNGCAIAGATPENSGLKLSIAQRNGRTRDLRADHVIAATGFKVDLRRLTVLAPELRARISTAGHAPILHSDFGTSVSGLYFVGPAAANSFGPVMRFVYGADFTSRHVARHLGRLKPAEGSTSSGQPSESQHLLPAEPNRSSAWNRNLIS